jgi:dihydroorotase-like cyclic amidohydrolase
MAQYIPMTQVTVNSVVMNDHIISAVLTNSKESQDITTQADTGRVFGPGLVNLTVTLEVQLDQAAANTTATLEALVGTRTTIIMKPMAGATSATNRSYTVSNAFLESFNPIDGTLGSIATTQAVFTGGSLVVAST